MRGGAVLDALISSTPLSSLALAEVPRTGIYAWWDREQKLRRYYPADFPFVDPAVPIYVGIAEKQGLRERGMEMHLKSTRWSTLRRSLASLLADELKLAHGVVSHPRAKFGLLPTQEATLTEWMISNLGVTWVVLDKPSSVESAVIASLLPPLNDRFAHAGPFWKPMQLRRDALRQRALHTAGSVRQS